MYSYHPSSEDVSVHKFFDDPMLLELSRQERQTAIVHIIMVLSLLVLLPLRYTQH